MTLHAPTQTGDQAHAGFTLIEMVFFISLMAFFLLISTQLWNATIVTTRESRAIASEGPRLDLILDRLKRDAWSGEVAAVDDEGGVMILRPNDRAVVWRVIDGHTLSRTVTVAGEDPAQPQRWPAFSSGIALRPVDGGIEVTVTPERGVAAPPMLARMPGMTIDAQEPLP